LVHFHRFGIFTAILYILCPLGNIGTFPPFWYILPTKKVWQPRAGIGAESKPAP
jgi:hypothetical protein